MTQEVLRRTISHEELDYWDKLVDLHRELENKKNILSFDKKIRQQQANQVTVLEKEKGRLASLTKDLRDNILQAYKGGNTDAALILECLYDWYLTRPGFKYKGQFERFITNNGEEDHVSLAIYYLGKDAIIEPEWKTPIVNSAGETIAEVTQKDLFFGIATFLLNPISQGTLLDFIP